LNVLTTSRPEEFREELSAKAYVTKTRGERTVGAARPLAEGRYLIVKHRDHSELIYALELPKRPGPAQEEFEIKEQASYILAVKNPAVTAPDVPASQEQPRYPAHLQEKFGRRRWIPVDDPELLDYENTQLLLLGARAEAVQEELGVEIDEEKETLDTAEVCRELKVCTPQRSLKPLLAGLFSEGEEEVR